MRLASRLSFLASLVFVFAFAFAQLACSSETPAPVVDASPPPRAFLSRDTVRDDGSVLVERVSYDVGGLAIRGEICRPKGTGPFPILLWAHGGFDGLGPENDGGLCLSAARSGIAFVASSYRGEDGSAGQIEVCNGEVDDTRTLLDIAVTQPWARAGKVTVSGPSHGGCVALRLAAGGVPAEAVAALVPFTHLDELFRSWREPGTAQNVIELRDRLEKAIGGSPTEKPAAYAERDPRNGFAKLTAFKGKILVGAATDDELVPTRITCKLATELPGFTRFRVTGADGTTSTSAPPACAAVAGLAFESGPRPSTGASGWNGSRFFVLYDQLGHGGGGAMGALASGDFGSFLGSVGESK